MKVIYITGISGTGKTTMYEELVKEGYQAISLDETEGLCFWADKKTKEKVEGDVILNRDFTSQHDWVCDVEYLKKLLTKDEDLVFVLGVATNQADFLDIFDKVLLLQCKPEIFIDRLEKRTNNDFGKEKSVRDHLLEWYEKFENNMLEKGAISINAGKPINEVFEDILQAATKG